MTDDHDVSDADSDAVPAELRERMENDPYCALLGIDLVDVRPGFARMTLTVTDDFLNFHGTPHGGMINSLADAAFAAASNSHGDPAFALETNISFLEAVEVGTILTATAQETHVTRRTGEYEVVVADEDGDRIATFRGRVYKP